MTNQADDLFGPKREGGPTRKQVLHKLIMMRRDIERLIGELSGDPDHRDYVAKIMAGNPTSARESRYEGPEDAEVVAERWGVDIYDAQGEIPNWFMERFGKHLD